MCQRRKGARNCSLGRDLGLVLAQWDWIWDDWLLLLRLLSLGLYFRLLTVLCQSTKEGRGRQSSDKKRCSRMTKQYARIRHWLEWLCQGPSSRAVDGEWEIGLRASGSKRSPERSQYLWKFWDGSLIQDSALPCILEERFGKVLGCRRDPTGWEE